MESCFIIQCRFSSSNLVRSSNWHFAHLVLQFPSTEHLHGNPHETSKGQISTFFDGGAKYLPNFSSQVASSSWRLSTSIIAPPKNISFAPLSMKLSWRFSVTCFRARVLCFEFRLDRWVGCWTTPSPLRPSRLLRIDVRLLVAPQESLLPSLTFSSLSSPAQIPQRTLTFPKFTPHTRPKNYRGSVCLLCRPFAGPSPAVGWASGADGVSAHTNVVPAGAGESRESTGVAERDSEILLLLSCCC